MNKKKVLALLAAATMLFGTVPVSATTITTGQATGVTSNVTGEATINDYDKSPIYQVTLPTGKALDFVIDPHNLMSLGTGSAVFDAEATGAGAILVGSGAGAIMKNESNVAVTVTVDFTLIDGATDKIKLVTNDAAVVSGEACNMLLAVVPGTAKTATMGAYTAADTVVALNAATGGKVGFKLAAADYETIVSGGAFKVQLVSDAANYDAAAFTIGGKVNKAADWTAYTGATGKDISLGAVFKIQPHLTEASASAVQVYEGAYGLVSDAAVTNGTVITGYVPASGETVSYTDAQGDYTAGSGVYVGLKGSNAWADPFGDVTSITKVTLNGSVVSSPTFNSNYVYFVDASLKSGTNIVLVEMNDGTVYKATFTK